jgi:hypothetical protein
MEEVPLQANPLQNIQPLQTSSPLETIPTLQTIGIDLAEQFFMA